MNMLFAILLWYVPALCLCVLTDRTLDWSVDMEVPDVPREPLTRGRLILLCLFSAGGPVTDVVAIIAIIVWGILGLSSHARRSKSWLSKPVFGGKP